MNEQQLREEGRSMNEQQLRAKIDRFAAEYVRQLFAGKIDAPGPSDCWGCYLVADTGEHPLGSDCVLGHIEEKYYVPSLLLRALKAEGASQAAKHAAAYHLRLAGLQATRPVSNGAVRKDIILALRKFCLKECGLKA
ncbi:MAG: hypothetical protein DDT20_00841 [Firmicutes bacterium]|nr:hypothetical protein [Bacillota bacterium]